MADEGHAQFPDPHYKPPPFNLEQYINGIYGYINQNYIWVSLEEGRIACRACGPGDTGYMLRKGASMDSHAEQRNPDTHQKNEIWLVIQYLKGRAEGVEDPDDRFHGQGQIPFPRWPDCYRPSRHGGLRCLICRDVVESSFDEEAGQLHDRKHDAWERIIMRPSRYERAGRRVRQFRQERLSYFDLVLRGQQEPTGPMPGDPVPQGLTPSQQRAYDRVSYVHEEFNPLADLARLDRAEGRDTPPPGHVFLMVDGRYTAIDLQELNKLEDAGNDKLYSVACNLYSLHAGTERVNKYICPGGSCQCDCHGPLIDDIIIPPDSVQPPNAPENP